MMWLFREDAGCFPACEDSATMVLNEALHLTQGGIKGASCISMNIKYFTCLAPMTISFRFNGELWLSGDIFCFA